MFTTCNVRMADTIQRVSAHYQTTAPHGGTVRNQSVALHFKNVKTFQHKPSKHPLLQQNAVKHGRRARTHTHSRTT